MSESYCRNNMFEEIHIEFMIMARQLGRTL